MICIFSRLPNSVAGSLPFLGKRLALAALAFALLPVYGAWAASDPVSDRFVALDANSDGQVCWEEFCSVNPNISRHGFDSIDTNGDGMISPDEWRAFSSRHSMGVSESTSGMTMPGRSAMPPVVMPPKEAGVQEPVAPGQAAVPGPDAPKQGAAPSAMPPAAPEGMRTPGMPLVTPPKEVKPAAPASPSAPLVMPPAKPEAVTMSRSERHEEN